MLMAPVLPEGWIGKLVSLNMYLCQKQYLYLFRNVSAFTRYQWPNCESWKFVCTCARVRWATAIFQTPNRIDWRPMNLILSWLLLSSQKSKCKLETTQQNLSQWCHTSHRLRGRSAKCTGINDDHHTAFVLSSNCITLRIDMVHLAENIRIAYGLSRTLWRMSCMRKGEEVRLNISRTSVQIYMGLIAGRRHCNVIRRHHSLLG